MGALLDLLFPPLCLDCHLRRWERLGLCPACLAKIEVTGVSACIRCGRHCQPGHCAPLDHHYSRVLSLAAYRGPWRQVVQRVKFGRARTVALTLARELATQGAAAGFARPQAIVPVPGAGKHWRSYDLLPLISQELSRSVGVPVLRILGRHPGRPPQVELDFRGRREGLAKYIYVEEGVKIDGGIVWLVDDVYTTGATADACAKALMEAGACSVYLLVLAT